MNPETSTGELLRGPREMLAGCIWLARLTDKVRLHRLGKLPDGYTPFLGHPRGVDGHFLRHFGLSRRDLDAIASAGDDRGVEQWFLSHPNASKDRIESWNQLAPNLGRAGYPSVAELQYVIDHVLAPDARGSEISTLFDAIELDEAAGLRKSPAT